jgi:SpoIID/LytB domain protein
MMRIRDIFAFAAPARVKSIVRRADTLQQMAARARTPLVLLVLVAAACAPPTSRLDRLESGARVPDALRVQFREGGATTIRRVPLEDYVQGAILSEFAPASGEIGAVQRMYEVQAVISRTYAIAHTGRHASEGFDVCATTHCQLYEPDRLRTSRWAEAARQATAATAGLVLWYGGGPASALFHSDCGGRTSDAASVWGGQALPYLASVIDDGPAAPAHATWTYDVDRETLRRALNAHPPTAVGASLAAIEVLERDAAQRIRQIRLRGARTVVVRGEEFRAAMTRAFGARSVKSTRFDIGQRGDVFTLEGRGFGHGVGLCQAGAYARVRAGTPLRDILARYYPGTRLRAARFGEASPFRAARFGEASPFRAARFGEASPFRAARFGEASPFRAARFGEASPPP